MIMCVHYFFAAKNQITRPFIECFEKGTPNFVSVPPCEFVLCIKHCIISRLQVTFLKW